MGLRGVRKWPARALEMLPDMLRNLTALGLLVALAGAPSSARAAAVDCGEEYDDCLEDCRIALGQDKTRTKLNPCIAACKEKKDDCGGLNRVERDLEKAPDPKQGQARTHATPDRDLEEVPDSKPAPARAAPPAEEEKPALAKKQPPAEEPKPEVEAPKVKKAPLAEDDPARLDKQPRFSKTVEDSDLRDDAPLKKGEKPKGREKPSPAKAPAHE